MANLNCYICGEETSVKSGWLNVNKLELCDDCKLTYLNIKDKFNDFDTRISSLKFGKYNDKQIERNILELNKIINKDEIVVDYLFGINEFFLNVGQNVGMVILTQKRFILYIPNIVAGNIYEYITNIENVIDVSFEYGITFTPKIHIRDKGGDVKTGKLQTFDNKEDVGRFRNSFNELQSNISNTGTQQSTQIIQQSDNIDKIKKLKELLDLGILSQEEFDEKKKTLLDNL